MGKGSLSIPNIKDSVETTNNPFEGNESIFLSTYSRATQRRGKLRDSHRRGVHKYTSKRSDTEEEEDPEIQVDIDKGNIVNTWLGSSI